MRCNAARRCSSCATTSRPVVRYSNGISVSFCRAVTKAGYICSAASQCASRGAGTCGPASGTRRPPAADEASAPGWARSIRVTGTPSPARRQAIVQPTIPPPMTTTSLVILNAPPSLLYVFRAPAVKPCTT